MGLESDLTLLRGVLLFAELPAEELRLITFSAARHDLAEGQLLFREGAPAKSGFVVLAGVVELTRGQNAKRRALARCEQGSLIGEMALLIENRRPATAIAVAPSQILEIERKAILRVLNEHPDVADRLRAALADRVSVMLGELERLRALLTEGGIPAQS